MGTEKPLRGLGRVASEFPDLCLHQVQEAGEDGVPQAEGQRGFGGLSSKNGCGCLSSSQEGFCCPTAPATPGMFSTLSLCQEIGLG